MLRRLQRQNVDHTAVPHPPKTVVLINICPKNCMHQLSEPESLSSSFLLFSDSGESQQDLLSIILTVFDNGKGV